MRPHRRQFLRLAAGAAVFPAVSRIARAQGYPTRPVRIVVGFPAGSSADGSARLMSQWLAARLGRPFIIENKPGAGGNIASAAVVGAPADGQTLLWTTAANATSAMFYDNLTFNFIRDIGPIAGICRTPLVMVVNPSVPTGTIPEFIAYAKASPGMVNIATGGIGTGNHLCSELLEMMTGIDLVHVHYRGDAPALTDVISGQVQGMFAGSAAIEHIRAGKLRAVAVTTASRWDALRDIPTVAESLPGYEASGFQGLGAPRNTPGEIIDRLNKEINAGLADPNIKARYADLGCYVLPGSPGDFGKLIAEHTEKWGEVIRAANIRPE